MLISVFRWQGNTDNTELVQRLSEASKVALRVVPRGSFKYLCLSMPSETLKDLRPNVEAVRQECVNDGFASRSIYFLKEGGGEPLTELDYIQMIEEELSQKRSSLAVCQSG